MVVCIKVMMSVILRLTFAFYTTDYCDRDNLDAMMVFVEHDETEISTDAFSYFL